VAARLGAELHEALEENGLTGPVTVAGSLLHLHLQAAPAIRTFADVNLDSEHLARLHLASLDEGVYFAPRGTLNVSTVLDEETAAGAVAAVGRAAARVAEEVGQPA